MKLSVIILFILLYITYIASPMNLRISDNNYSEKKAHCIYTLKSAIWEFIAVIMYWCYKVQYKSYSALQTKGCRVMWNWTPRKNIFNIKDMILIQNLIFTKNQTFINMWTKIQAINKKCSLTNNKATSHINRKVFI